MLSSPLFAYRVSGSVDGIEPPLPGDTLQLVHAAVEIAEHRCHDDVVRARPEGLAGDRHVSASGVLDLGDLHGKSVPLHWFRGYDDDGKIAADRGRLGRNG